MKKLFFLSYGGGHVQILLRVLCTIDRHFSGQFSTVIVGLTTAAREFQSAGYVAKRFCDYVNSITDARALAVGEKLAAEMHTEGLGVEYQESVAYLGLSMWDLITRVGEAEAWRLLGRVAETGMNKRMAFCPVSVLERILRRERPDVVVTTNSPKTERAALAAAERLGIPAVRIEDLFGVSPYMCYLKMTMNSDAGKIVVPIRPDRVAVLNELARRNVLARQSEEELCVEPQNVRVTGQPVIDQAAVQARALSKQACRLRTQLPEDQTALLWATDNLPTDRPIFESLRQAIGKHPSWFLLIKLHPGFSPDLRDFYEQHKLANMRVLGTGNIHELIVAADVVVTHLSTVGVETLALTRPLVLVEFKPEAEFLQADPLLRTTYRCVLPYIRDQARKVVSDLAQLGVAIEEATSGLLQPHDHEKFLNTDGKAAARIVGLIDELVA